MKQHFCRKHFPVVVVTRGGPIKDLPDKENAPDFDDTLLRGELGSTSASVIVRTVSIPIVSRM